MCLKGLEGGIRGALTLGQRPPGKAGESHQGRGVGDEVQLQKALGAIVGRREEHDK